MEGFSVYYNTLPNNDINKWLVDEKTEKRFNNEVPDLFTPGGIRQRLRLPKRLRRLALT